MKGCGSRAPDGGIHRRRAGDSEDGGIVRREKEEFLALLRSRGQRVTRERLALFEEIFVQHEHIDAERLRVALEQRGVPVSRATVYRNLDLLVQAGFVRRTRLGHDRLLFEHVHGGQDHDHLVCTVCGRVAEFVSPGIAALQAEICRAHGFVAARHALEIFGLCNGCASEEATRPSGTGSRAAARARSLRPVPARRSTGTRATGAGEAGTREAGTGAAKGVAPSGRRV